MAGLGEILEENQILRERLAEMEVQVRAQATIINKQEKQLVDKESKLKTLQGVAEDLARKLEIIRLEQLGPRSQRYVPDEQEILPFKTEIKAPPRAPKAEEPESTDDKNSTKKASSTGKNRPKRRGRDSLNHLAKQQIICPASEDATCADCGGSLTVIGQAESFRVDWVPGHFVRHDITRDKCACPNCPDQGVLTVPGPYILDKALCGNGLLARVLVDKFADHIPLNRQAKRMGREGLDITSNTLANWVLRSAEWLKHVAKAVQQDLLSGDFLQADDTGFPVQDAKNGQLRKGRLWAFTDQEQAFYAFTETKEGKHPDALLDQFQGSRLLVDGGSEFNEVVRKKGLERGGCWSHLRTYFYKARHHHPGEAAAAMGTIHDLFMIERDIWGTSPERIGETRQKKSKELVDGFFDWVKAMSVVVRPKSAIGEAITYASNQQAFLCLFLDHPDLPMHNNLSELMLRQAVVGRKNWLFARSEGGAEAASTMYTLIGSCMLQGIDPYTYLVDVFNRLPEYPSNRIDALTPKQWAYQRAKK
jgi:transposase